AAGALRAAMPEVLDANALDHAAGAAKGLTAALLDRLRLDPARIEGIAAALEAVAALPDPTGAVIDRSERPNGMVLERVRVPIGVIGIIYESR
ncbi:gamma-glutamyl-phosphate reductase, partial [Streptomyces sp. EL5]|nr:gamma-glutamyl-phosphate reductase [Streptomyces sp. EL5]